MGDETLSDIQKAISNVARKRDCDVLFYNGDLERPHDDKVIEEVLNREPRRKNVILVLCTYGGDPNAAYRIAKCLQSHYKKFTVAVAGFCKSAGTLIVCGANSLILLENAELGPLDIQLRKSDELEEFSSGLTPTQAITTLGTRSIATFTQAFLEMKRELLLTTKTAAEIASKLAVGLYQPIMEQLDPMRIGEMDRAVSIVSAYGERLMRKGKNVKDGALSRLVVGYPSHSFVIDREEAKELFKVVEDPVDDELDFYRHLELLGRRPLDKKGSPYIFFMDEPEDADDSQQPSSNKDSGEQGDPGASSSGGQQAGPPDPPTDGSNDRPS